MKPFSLEPGMLTIRGVFYPTGYLFVMLPTVQDAEKLSAALQAIGYDSEEEPMLATSEAILEQIAPTVRQEDHPLPSVGTEGATVHEYEKLARKGHCGVLIHAPTGDDTERVMEAVHKVPFSYAQKYRRLVIEDMA